MLPSHHLDTELHEYYKIINEVVIPECMDVAADTKLYPNRAKNFISYMVPAFTDRWNFGVELTYRMVAPPEHQTPENIKKARILRAVMDMCFSMTAIFDDIADNSTQRRNKKTWHMICPGGKRAAMYDGCVLSYFAFRILKNHFKSDPGYALLMQTVTEANTKTLIGQTLDFLGQSSDLSPELYLDIASYKAGRIFCAVPVMGAIHAEVLDEEILQKMNNVFVYVGRMFQMWDDFQDYFNDPSKTGKPPCDFYNAGNSWVSSTALQYFNERQKEIFMECYGSADPEKVETVMSLYDEIDMPRKYIERMRRAFFEVSEMIETLPEQRFKTPLYSYIEWLIEDVCDPHYEKTKHRLGL